MVLVAGTVVYGRGDEEGAKEELSSAVAAALAADAPEAAAASLPGEAAPLLGSSAPMSMSRAVPVVEAPVVSSSLKATMNIMSASYSRSFTRGSLPRGSFNPGGLAQPPSRDSNA